MGDDTVFDAKQAVVDPARRIAGVGRVGVEIEERGTNRQRHAGTSSQLRLLHAAPAKKRSTSSVSRARSVGSQKLASKPARAKRYAWLASSGNVAKHSR